MKKVPLKTQPGIVKTESPYSQPGRYVDGDKVRFLRGQVEKIGGWTKYSATAFVGKCRKMHSWDDLARNNYLAGGTHCKLEVFGSTGTKTDITPFKSTGTLAADPISTINGSSVVTIGHTSHGVSAAGDTVVFSGATAVGGLTVDGAYVVQSIVDINNYTIDAATNATSTATGGGASVVYSYELGCGPEDTTTGGGWGVGGWGQGTWDTARTNLDFVQVARTWSLVNYGANLLAMPVDGSLYQWALDTSARAVVVANAPTSNTSMFVTDDRHVIVLGAGGSPMKIQWPDQDDITDWTPTISNTSNERTLGEGSRLIAGTVLSNLVNLVWSDTSVYALQRTTSQAIFVSRLRGKHCGLISPNAFTVVDGAAFWMSGHDLHMYNGAVRDIPNAEDVRDWMIRNIERSQDFKTFCGYNPRYNEVSWFFVPIGELEPRYYVTVNIDSWWWTHGTLDRTAMTTQESGDKRPVMVDRTGIVFFHESGVDADGVAMDAYITRAPSDIEEGDVVIDIYGFYPDFQRHNGNIQLELKTFDYPNEDASNPLEVHTDTLMPNRGVADFQMAGRQLEYTLRSNVLGGDFRLGTPRAEIQQGGSRR